ncbi:hypothetical protein HGRIS_013756 [Hohenbuehelia grisea]|uniref:PPM-type phosphatase domain-containing protein n=1 Tax=Hohenbuehelia grisea TaxID=104357 RepID=A0ABR3IWP4_9AGAR
MLVTRASYDWAFADDIPGSRCDPEDGPWPRAYRVLDDASLWRELSALAKPQSKLFDPARGFKADSLNFQPCPRTRTQDRYVVRQLNVHGRTWTFTGVFDGHLGDVTVEHVSHHLPIIVREFLEGHFEPNSEQKFTPEAISDLFTNAISAFDDAIAQDVLGLFGGSMEGVARYSDSEIRQIINDQHAGGANWRKARLCMYGTTALVALVDPDHTSLWLAQLGDCQATLVTFDEKTNTWNTDVLTREQNGDNDAEIARVQKEHPGEAECVVDRRVLGALAPFRCLGDIPFKQPPEFSRRILYNLLPGFHDTGPWEEFLVRNKSPPYISAIPEITYRRLAPRALGSIAPPRYLILSSDGFADLCNGTSQAHVITAWARKMESIPPMSPVDPAIKSNNMALRLLREALGGDDHCSVSRVLTLDMESAWIDDTSIVVQTL